MSQTFSFELALSFFGHPLLSTLSKGRLFSDLPPQSPIHSNKNAEKEPLAPRLFAPGEVSFASEGLSASIAPP